MYQHAHITAAVIRTTRSLAMLVLASGFTLASAQNTPPYKGQYAGNTPSGPITAVSGQVIEGLRISSPNTACITIPEGVTGVTIRNNDIGPCGESETSSNMADWGYDVGVHIKGSHVNVEHNTIHDVRTAIAGDNGAKHPISITRNLAWDIRGPLPRGQFVQLGRVVGGEGQTSIVGNISDKYLSEHPTQYEDHINLFGSEGTPAHPMVIACNKFRGGDSRSGSGIVVGDDGGGWADIRDNIFVMTTNVGGVGCASCHDTMIQRNWVYGFSDDPASLTSNGFLVMQDEDPGQTHPVARNVTFKENRAWSKNWNWGQGEDAAGFYTDGSAINLSLIGNLFQDSSLTEDIWGHTPSACQ